MKGSFIVTFPVHHLFLLHCLPTAAVITPAGWVKYLFPPLHTMGPPACSYAIQVTYKLARGTTSCSGEKIFHTPERVEYMQQSVFPGHQEDNYYLFYYRYDLVLTGSTFEIKKDGL